MPATDKHWSRGFALQALSDLLVYDALFQAKVPSCHRLHFLQMAAEKTCKARLIQDNGYANVKKTHACVGRILPLIARYHYPLMNKNKAIPRWQLTQIRKLSREIELLAPAVHDFGARPDNSEYPWLDSNGDVQTPCQHPFNNLSGDRALVGLVRFIRTAAEFDSQ